MDSIDFAHTCPHCGVPQDTLTSALGDSRQPSVGDRSICFKCAGVMIFDLDIKGNLEIRQPTISELIQTMKNPTVVNMVSEILKMRGQQID